MSWNVSRKFSNTVSCKYFSKGGWRRWLDFNISTRIKCAYFISQEPTETLPQAVAEMLRTSKGTGFYVLQEAGEHGIKWDMPEVEELEEPDAKYLANSKIAENVFNEIKKKWVFLDI